MEECLQYGLIDLEIALQSGLPMRFSTADVPMFSTTAVQRILQPTHTKLYEQNINAELICMLSDVTVFVNTLNTIDKMSRLDPLDFSEQAFSLIHRLINFAPLQGQRPTNQIEDLLQLVLLATMTTALPNYTADQVRYDLLAKQVRRAIQQYVATTNEDRNLLLWALFIGRISILHDDDDTWIMPSIREICKNLNVTAWPQVQKVLRQYSWIHILHDKTAIKIWESVKRNKIDDNPTSSYSLFTVCSTVPVS
ncbi:hypothetical protein N0V90_003499 [Kalmusia sp. IMI 367209]|nr:hypothetical protein N0V90_003499 [Kalmusia sp. IMI 367209]